MAPDSASAIDYSRAAAAEISERVRLNYLEADGNFEVTASEAVFPEDETRDISTSELNIALKDEEARAVVERWLIEARVGRDRASFSFPPPLGHLGAGDVVKLAEPGGLASYRIDQLEQGDQGLVQALRVDETLYEGSMLAQKPLELAAATPLTPVFPLFLDLPLITGDKRPHAPYIAATAEPWPGPVALYNSRYNADFALNTVLKSPAVLGVTVTPLTAATLGILDRGAPLEVELTRGSLSGVTLEALMAGANLAAIGDGSQDNWEIFQFQSADLVAPGRYGLSGRSRAELGSDSIMPVQWPAGYYFVLLDGAPQQIELPASGRNLVQYFQIGPAAGPYPDYSYRKLSAAFVGNGLRPNAPVHLAEKRDGVDLEFSWIRRARLDGAFWDLAETPLSETQELYQAKIFSGANRLRQEQVHQTQLCYSAAMQALDGAHGPL